MFRGVMLRKWSGHISAFKRQRREGRWNIEILEGRLLLSAMTPAQVSHAYGVDQIMFGAVKGDGTGQTIAIVDAYDAPTIQSDLAAFNAAFGLPNTDGKGAPVLTVAKPSGTPAYNSLWAQEISLDVEWAHAIAPGAHILLVEAASSNLADLLSAVDYARNQPGVSVVSMSWGATEFSSETIYDSYFTTPAGHTNVSFVASSGDQGGVKQWPALSTNVLAVGGTSLSTSDSLGTYSLETGWSGSGGGVSAYESKPSFQSSVTQSSTMRSGPDVSYVADPGTGVQVYFSGSWYTFGGTSAGAPQWAAIVAIADQGRAINGQAALDGKNGLLPAVYNLPASDFHDITSGTAGSNTAGAGYDLVTGRGSPYANYVVRDLLTVAAGTTTTTTSGGTTSGGTTTGTGGSTKGGKGGGRPKVQHAFVDASDILVNNHLVQMGFSSVAGQLPDHVPVPVSQAPTKTPQETLSTVTQANAFGSPLTGTGAPFNSSRPTCQDEGRSIVSQLSDDPSHNTADPTCAERNTSAKFGEWTEELTAVGRSIRGWSGTSLRSNQPVDPRGAETAAPEVWVSADDIDAFFASLIGDKWALTESEAA